MCTSRAVRAGRRAAYSEPGQRTYATANGAAEKGSEDPRMRATRRGIDWAWIRAARGANSTENRSCAAADDHADQHGMSAGVGGWRRGRGPSIGRRAL